MRKSKRQEEYEETLLELYFLAKILTNEHYRRAFVKEVEDMGNFGTDMIRVLAGQEPKREWLK